MKNILFSGLVFIICIGSFFAQNQPFSIRYEALLNGDISVIGNNISNRKTLFSNADKPYNDINANAKNNDDFSMQYINIDEKNANFSSSSAFLTLNTNERVSLKYAGLYWAATYPYAEGKLYSKDRFVANKTERETIDAVKLKLPKSTDYQTIIGKVIYDGKGKTPDAPYVVYADITSLVEKLPSWEGEYFVANVRSATGNITNGVSAGWVIVFIYEKENAPLQKFISYDGFLPIKNKQQIVFENFKTPEFAPVKAKLVGTALGTDAISNGSSFTLSTAGNQEYTMESSTRKATHFLNSSITENDDYVYSRKPNSMNTLGFDIFCQDIENQDNKYIPNNISKINLDIFAPQNPAYLFMTTLAITASKPINENSSFVEPFEITNETLNAIESVTEETKSENKIIPEKEITPQKPQKDVKVLSLPDIKSGYYIIVGAFSSEENSQNFVEELKSIGTSATYFFNKDRKLYYIYTTHHLSYTDAEKAKEHIRSTPTDDEPFFKSLKEAWILGVNLSENKQ